ncbi:MAG: hypothetical protein HYW08_12560 [candidate division NC10 bacterium]|nr:hypothetical protein [candidate division NC10 bacterium]MBI2454726.1 hypothetical protein [candidate division NC10 bacterium]MBI2563195.1 hypothetical protein [candidate division NC10 bacterium]
MGQRVHTEEINEYPEDLKAEYLRLSEWVRDTRKTYGQQVVVRIVDPQSLGGLWKVLRHRIRRFPTFLVDGAEKVVGWEGDPDGAVSLALARRAAPVPGEARA